MIDEEQGRNMTETLARGRRSALFLALLWGLSALPAQAETCVTDDADREVCLAQPASRIVTLSPGATELVFAAGAGERVVGVVSFSDYPPEARQRQSVGSHTRLDLETLLALEPDLLVGWVTGNPHEQIERLQALGLPLYLSEPRRFEDVATSLERLGALAGTRDTAQVAADDFRAGIEALRQRHREAAPVRVFYQVWDEPLMTVNDKHLISQAMALCGGDNVFGGLPRLVPRISEEAVLGADPEAIVAGGMGEENRDWLDAWERFEELSAVRRDNLFFVPPSLIQRPTPRLVEGARILCDHLETARGPG